ncbi:MULTISPECIES: phage tail family protein [Bacillus cereus group]|uniref:Phage tail family protein n=1 Tax=Bacillus thuringiensis TaxID=1428 RepID=A0A4Y8SWA9_BACTU|nr:MULTISPECIES: phage tail family protein [Bacillus cereus group]MDV6367398.1 phage tail family protein [Bacillus cereus]TFF43609.1 phage tail family protein [Bacillus thuringiensis]
MSEVITLGTTVQTLSGKKYVLEELGIMTRDFNPQSPSPVHNFETVEKRNGTIDRGTVYGQRTINCSFYFKAVDMWDYALLRDEVFRLFDSREAFYIIDQRNPGKRWLVKYSSPYSIEQNWKYGFFEIDFVTVKLPFAESIGTTMDDFTFDSNLWQIGQGLVAEDTKYTHNTTSFRIYNAGHVTIDPKEMPLKITYTGWSDQLAIKNLTTGDIWSYGKSTVIESSQIVLDGVKSYRPGVGSIFKDTNWKLITLKPGWNDFVLSGTSGNFKIEFNFRFYYL